MRTRTATLLTATILALSACGGDGGVVGLPPDPDDPVIQVRGEGGFMTPEMNLGRGPAYTLLADGRLIYEGPVLAIYPGPLLPNYQVTRLTEERVDELLALIEEIGLPEMDSERDDSAMSNVADGTTEVVTFWDENGAHTYSVYALGSDPNPSDSTAATADLMVALSEAAFSGESESYAGDRVRIISGVALTPPDPEFEDVRPWPLDGEDPNEWSELALGFSCGLFGTEVLESFRDATQVTQWMHPEVTMDAPPYILLVRSLHPGEPDCPS